jgi:hypothetical protein
MLLRFQLESIYEQHSCRCLLNESEHSNLFAFLVILSFGSYIYDILYSHTSKLKRYSLLAELTTNTSKTTKNRSMAGQSWINYQF